MIEPNGGQEAELKPPRDGRPWLAGTLGALSIIEVVQLIFTSLKSGVLRLSFTGPGGAEGGRPHRRSLYFREGQLVFAASSEPCDRLGPVLWRSGLIVWDSLVHWSRSVGPGRPLGQVLVEGGVLTSADLYAGVAAQVREVLFAAFLDAEGEFLFVEGPHGEQNEVRLPERTRDLLLEGLKRVEETERLLAVVGGRAACLTRAAAPPPGASEYTLRLLEALEGAHSFAEAADASRLGLLCALREAAPLVEAGVLISDAAAAAPPAAEPPGIEVEVEAPVPVRPAGPFELYRRIFRRVHGVLASVRPGAEQRLDSYFERLPEARRFIFEGVRFAADGDLDTDRVVANVTATGAYRGAAARARALEGLEELLTFSLFEVKNVLPKAEADALLREVGKMQVGKA